MAEVDIWSWPFWRPTNFEDMRNLVLMGAGCIALVLATWRSWLAQKQIRLSEAGQNIDRYQKGAAMLGDARMSVRQAGIFGLAELVDKDPHTYFGVVLELLCSFVRDRSDEQRRDAQQEAPDQEAAQTPQEGEAADDPDADRIDIAADCQTAFTKISDLRRGPGQRRRRAHWLDPGRFLPARDVPQKFQIPLLVNTVNRIDLSRANLVGANLIEANLIEANLIEANLIEAKLFRANLIEADLSKAGLSKADLSKADLTWADLSGANLREADLSGADLSKADLSKADLTWADLNWADLSGVDLSRANLSEVDLSGANLIEANLSGANLREADLSGADLSKAGLTLADLSGVDLSEADLTWANLIEADLSGANLSGANLSGADLTATVVTAAQLQSARNVNPKWIDDLSHKDEDEDDDEDS